MQKPDHFLGTSLGKYNLVEYLGEGGMAKVYKAFHPELKRYAAIKIMLPRFFSDQKVLSRFQTEAQNLAMLRHPNIVQVYDASVSGKFPYIVMEYVEGKSLKQFIQEYNQRHTRIPLSYTLRIVYSIGLALAFSHQNKMVHRDVKPANVILEDTGRVVLTDFGLAQIKHDFDDSEKDSVEGTPAYISPEQALGKPAEPRSDLYSLGVIFFEMLTGRQPFDTKDPVSMAINHVTHQIPSPKEYFPELEDEIAEIVVKATQKNLNARYNNLAEFLNHITRVRIKAKTAKLPTASLKDLKISEDDVGSWSVPARNWEDKRSVVCLHIVDTGQVLDLELNREYMIGRQHRSQPILPDIDLTPFKAYEWGISRLHASLTVTKDEVTITDIG
ncbi:MAG: protein kinase, partial [candidate division Zixibacteria bacterium]|nr:protein kinase [candidate division Zixibacteria bacterium]